MKVVRIAISGKQVGVRVLKAYENWQKNISGCSLMTFLTLACKSSQAGKIHNEYFSKRKILLQVILICAEIYNESSATVSSHSENGL